MGCREDLAVSGSRSRAVALGKKAGGVAAVNLEEVDVAAPDVRAHRGIEEQQVVNEEELQGLYLYRDSKEALWEVSQSALHSS